MASGVHAFRNVVEKGLLLPRPAATPGCWETEVCAYPN